MFLKFSKFFVCFLLLTAVMSNSFVFAAEGDNPDATESAPVNDTSSTDNNPSNEDTPTPSEDTSTESSSTETPIEKEMVGDNEFSEEPKPEAEAEAEPKPEVAVAPTSNTFLNSVQPKIQKRAPVVNTSEISKAIDDDYSFLYDPNMKPEIITDMANNPDNYVIMYLETGDTILIRLKEAAAPNTVVRFKKLVKDKFYDDMEIFRAIPDYLVQTGDPSGSGYGGKGVFYFAEITPNEKFKRGSVAMSNNGNLQSDDTQFFITFNSFDWLDGKYTIFGEVILGMNKLENVSKSFANDGFVPDPTIITKVELLSQRPTDRVDDLSKIIPQEKQIEAIKKQEENKRREEAKQKFLIESEKQQEALKEMPKVEVKNNADDNTDMDNEASIDEQNNSQSNPYLNSRRRR